ncbi:Indoleamine 2,3-dioxygenase [Hygrophoropsis aurantiaca]|uniref:Indoleamine 2,3-dioxygenase n=1 Tax=Hygrophoropsis aurantiaca TaxID=72124 RepID=A0ACB8AE46_9AGAM|nr:Indoleamine 2,3-dioxygenase [Hygrophoropsis aurantiaca]
MYPIDLLPSPLHVLDHAFSVLNSFQLSRRPTPAVRPTPVHFDINIGLNNDTGFFPERPLPRLPEAYAIWEDALARAQEVLVLGDDLTDDDTERRASGELWRAQIRSFPVISSDALNADKQLLRRAHKVLAFLVHFYVHSIPPRENNDPIIVPRSLVAPLLEVSAILQMAPVLTFADTVLWNWSLINPDLPVTMDNMEMGTELFSGTEDERNFYLTSAKAEMKGIEMLRVFDEYHNLPNVTDLSSICKINRLLTRLRSIVQEIEQIILSVREIVDPHMFYWEVRPWFNGSASGASKPAWIYEGVRNTELLDLSGPSAGQSSVMHALDIFLDIDHKIQQRRYPAPSEGNKRADHGFMERMRRYMPGRHREYLAYLGSTRPLRDVAQNVPAVREQYNAAVTALKKFRDSHMRIACLYIVTMSRSSPPPGCPMFAMMQRMERQKASTGPVTGTGGNELSLLLKAGRDATTRAVLKGN